MTANDTICDAIKSRKVLSFTYDGKLRTLEPHMLGYDADGDLTLYAYQLTGTGAGFRNFHMRKASFPHPTGGRFLSMRRGYNPNDPRIHRVICRL